YLFDRDGLKAVTIPIHIDEPTDDRAMKAAHNAERIRDLLPRPPEYVRLKDAGHDVFVAPCPEPLRAGIPAICIDAPGIDRVAVHRQVNAEMADFFRRALAAP